MTRTPDRDGPLLMTWQGVCLNMKRARQAFSLCCSTGCSPIHYYNLSVPFAYLLPVLSFKDQELPRVLLHGVLACLLGPCTGVDLRDLGHDIFWVLKRVLQAQVQLH